MKRPAWQLPPGVRPGTWEYVCSPHIASQYDAFLHDHPLFRLDLTVLERLLNGFPRSQPIIGADFGCGSGRVGQFLADRRPDVRLLNIDLSRDMLRQAAKMPHDRCFAIQANLVELSFLHPQILDFATCLFSSLGMLSQRKFRVEFLSHTCRVLKPGCPLLVHVHNRYQFISHWSNFRWLITSWIRSRREPEFEYGDRVYQYRGLAKMFLHIYSRKELIRDLQEAGFREVETLRIDASGGQILDSRGFMLDTSAGGYFAIARA